MTREEVYEKLNGVFRDVFDDEDITVNDATTADDIDDWDSLEHINLVVAVEKCFGIKFTMGEVTGMKNVGEMADIILGLLVPQYGKIKIDGVDIFRHIDMWHHGIGYIPQTIYLSDDTIRNNVAFGVEEELIDNDAVEEALKKAQLWNFIEGLSDGLETFVGDRGVRLSGGQRQRIGIARALYHDPEILILDEATSALDNDTEAAVMEAIEKLHGEKTMIIIAHRLTTLRNADVIYEVADGKVIQKEKQDIL